MTVAVACNLPDGVVLGFDSAVTLHNNQGYIIKTYEHAEKLFQLGQKPVGIAAYGMGALGQRTIGSYIRGFEVLNPHKVVTEETTVKDVVEELRLFFLEQYWNTVVPQVEASTGLKFKEIVDTEKPIMGFAVGGFSAGRYLSEVWEIVIPFHDSKFSSRLWCAEGDFKPVWFARNEPILRYQLGYDQNMLEELKVYFEQLRGSSLTDAENADIARILERYTYPIPYFGMPIKEGVDYVRFVVEMVINHHRFATGSPVVGGEAQIGLVTHKGEKFQIL